MHLTILVQVAAVNWNGGTDFCLKRIDGELIYKLTLERCEAIRSLFETAGHQADICLIAPNRDAEHDAFMPDFQALSYRYFFGDANDVLNRILSCSEKFQYENILRVNGSFWYLDEGLTEQLLTIFARQESDLVKLPANFPHGFSGDFMTISALRRLRSITQGHAIVNPVAALADHPIFRTTEYTPPPGTIEPARVALIREKRLQYEPERAEYDETAVFVPGSIYHNIYHKSLDFVSSKDVVLDIASGAGYGSDILAGKARFVYGGDYDIEAVHRASDKYRRDNLSYVFADATDLPFRDHFFDVVVSMETIEHVDENQFMLNISRVLKPRGFLVVSTPQNNFGFTLTPWHVKEYSLAEIKDLLNPSYDIVKVYGCSSGEVSDRSETGDRMMVVARRR